jgi:uncharacterized protein YecA (UPF0149 family)
MTEKDASNLDPKREKETRKYPFITGNGRPLIAKSIGRNDLCPCGSKKKVKNCCKLETKYFTKKAPVKIPEITELIDKP